MTTATRPAASPAPVGPQPGPGAGLARPESAPEAPSPTARRLRRLILAVLAAGVGFGLIAGTTFALQARALSRAEASAAQLVRVQQIQTDLLGADAIATNAFLVGGLEPPAQRATYDRLIEESSRLIAEAADAQPADREALAVLNAAVVDYASTVELARANNRQGFPVGAQYLRTASAGLRTTALPALDTLVAVNADRAAGEMATRPAIWAEVTGVLVLIGFGLIMVFLARTFRRTLNLGMLIGAVVLLLAVVGGAVVLTQTGNSLRRLQDQTFTDLNAAAQARIRANDAKANESLTLISRGSGGAFEQAWQNSAARVAENLTGLEGPDLTGRWEAYTGVHAEIRELDNGGRWDDAVALATGTGQESANAAFATFDTAASERVRALAAELGDGLGAPRIQMIIAALLTLAAGVAAALLGRWGLAARLEEYR